MQIAVQNDNLDMVRLLLDLGLDPDDRYRHHHYDVQARFMGSTVGYMRRKTTQYDLAELLH